MSTPITASVAVWLSPGRQPHEILALKEAGSYERLASKLTYYGPANLEKFCEYTRIGTAQITLELISHDQQVQLAVASLDARLDELDQAYRAKRSEFLTEKSKLLALPCGVVA